MHAQHQPRRLHRAFDADRLDAAGREVLQLKGRVVRDQRSIPERACDRPGHPQPCRARRPGSHHHRSAEGGSAIGADRDRRLRRVLARGGRWSQLAGRLAPRPPCRGRRRAFARPAASARWRAMLVGALLLACDRHGFEVDADGETAKLAPIGAASTWSLQSAVFARPVRSMIGNHGRVGNAVGRTKQPGVNNNVSQRFTGFSWRKGWDLNPRGACTPGGFQD